MSKKQRAFYSILYSSAFLSALMYIAGYFGGLRGIETGITSGLAVVAIFWLTMLGMGLLGTIMLSIFTWIDKGK